MSAFSRLVGVAFLVTLLASGAAAGSSPVFATAASADTPAPPPHAAPGFIQGPKPFVTLLCKLAGVAAEPEAPAFFRDLVAAPRDGLNDYWREVSFGGISLEGSEVVGWRELPGNAAYYKDSNGDVDLRRLASDCLTLARDDHDLPRFAAVSLVFNADLDPHPQAGTACANHAGARECFHAIWMWPAWLHNEAAWAHEMGHLFGLSHSADPSGGDYSNVWDVMSTITGCTCGHGRNAMPQHPIAYHLDRLGWIPEAKKYAASQEGVAVIRLEQTSQPTTNGYLMARVPTGSPNLYYTVEARGRAGFDVHIPGAAVLIHEINLDRPDQPAHLVVVPEAGPITTASGMWLPGSRFMDAKNLVSIEIEAATDSGFVVSIRTGSAALHGATARAAVRSAFIEIASSEWPAQTSLLGLAAAAQQQVYVVSAQATTLGMSPSIQVSRILDTAWSAAEHLPSGWSNASGDAPAIAVAPSGAVSVAWSGSDHAFATMSAGANTTADIWLVNQSARGDWSTPLRIDDDPGRTAQLSPALATDGRGNITAAWEDTRDSEGDIYFVEVIGGRAAKNRRLNDDRGKAPQTAPAIAADAEGNVEVLWVDMRSGANEIYEARRSASGEWRANTRLAAAGIDVYDAPSVTVDDAGNFYAAWIAYPACMRAKGETGAVMVSVRPRGATWQSPVTLRSGIAGGREVRPVTSAGSGGRVYVAWEERAGDGALVYLAIRTAPGDWSQPQAVAESSNGPLARPALAVDAAGRVYLANLVADGASTHLAVLRAAR